MFTQQGWLRKEFEQCFETFVSKEQSILSRDNIIVIFSNDNDKRPKRIFKKRKRFTRHSIPPGYYLDLNGKASPPDQISADIFPPFINLRHCIHRGMLKHFYRRNAHSKHRKLEKT